MWSAPEGAEGSGRSRDLADEAERLGDGVGAVGLRPDDALGVAEDQGLGVGVDAAVVGELEPAQRDDVALVDELELVVLGDDEERHQREVDLPALAVGRRGAGGRVAVVLRAGHRGEPLEELGRSGDQAQGLRALSLELDVGGLDGLETCQFGGVDSGAVQHVHILLVSLQPVKAGIGVL